MATTFRAGIPAEFGSLDPTHFLSWVIERAGRAVGYLVLSYADSAEEAFQEALAHDAGSVRGALGLMALCERLGRTEEAARYAKVAQRCWAKADPADFERLKGDLQ